MSMSPSKHSYKQLRRDPITAIKSKTAKSCISLLGLINISKGNQPVFTSDVVKAFYQRTKDIVQETLRSKPLQVLREDVQALGSWENLFKAKVEVLLREFGHKIWGHERSHLIRAAQSTPYPRNLYFNRRRDAKKIRFFLHLWLAIRTYQRSSSGLETQGRTEIDDEVDEWISSDDDCTQSEEEWMSNTNERLQSVGLLEDSVSPKRELDRRELFDKILNPFCTGAPSNKIPSSCTDSPPSFFCKEVEEIVCFVNKHWTEADLERIFSATLASKAAFVCWVHMHEAIQRSIGYGGYAGKEWTEARIAAAQNDLGIWACRKRARGKWVDESTFNHDFASFFSVLVDLPRAEPKRLAKLLEKYNKGLLAWFH